MIHICYGMYDRDGHYSKFVGVSAASIFEHTRDKVTVHILHDETLTDANRKIFDELAENFGQQINFYDVSDLCREKLADFKEKFPQLKKERFSIGTLYRLLSPEVLPQEISKIIYLDADTYVNLDIAELWNFSPEEKPLAAVAEKNIDATFKKNLARKYLLTENFVKPEDYFNAGVLIMNLDYFRKNTEEFESGIKFLTEHPQCDLFDQDLLNKLYAEKYLKLPDKFDAFVTTERVEGRRKQSRPAIYHFIDISLDLDLSDALNEMWFQTFKNTGWHSAEIFGNMYRALQDFHTGEQDRLLNLSAIMSGRSRIFYTSTERISAVKKIFGVQKFEEVIDSTKSGSLKKLIKICKNHPDKRIVFIYVENPEEVETELSKNGLRQGFDFIRAEWLFSPALGEVLHTHVMLKGM